MKIDWNDIINVIIALVIFAVLDALFLGEVIADLGKK